MASIAPKRLAKELKELNTSCPVGIALLQADNYEYWKLSLQVMGDNLYKDQVFAVQFRFSAQYPIASPEVTFVVDDQFQAPIHPHVYSNGHICASILGSEWSPVLSVQGVCVTLQSMLASCTKLERPQGNDAYVRNAPKSPKNARFVYDGDIPAAPTVATAADSYMSAQMIQSDFLEPGFRFQIDSFFVVQEK